MRDLLLLIVICGVLIATLVAAPGYRSVRGRMRWAMTLVYVGFGFFHLAAADRFLPIMPPILPYPRLIIWFTGVCEIVGGIGLVTPATRRWAGMALAAYAVCVFPANVYHALWGIDVPGLPSSWWYHGPRLLFQPVFVWWALFAGEVIDWPFDSNKPEFARDDTVIRDAAPASPTHPDGIAAPDESLG